MSNLKPNKKRFKEWCYFKLHVTSQIKEKDDGLLIDNMTWRQLINNALRRSHGLFGEATDYHIINQEDKVAYVRIRYTDKDMFSSGISTYISSDELVGVPLVVNILQETPNLEQLDVHEDDTLWLRRSIDEDIEDSQC